MKPIIILLMFFQIFYINVVNANSAQIINSGSNEYKSVMLTPEIYNNCGQGLLDIRVLGSSGTELPYFINSHSLEEKASRYGTTLINSFTKGNDFYFDYEVSNLTGQEVISTSIQIETTDTEFAKEIRLLGSYDNIKWENIINQPIYSIGNSDGLEVFFGQGLAYKYFRFIVEDNIEQISFNNVWLKHDPDIFYNKRFIQKLITSYSIEENGDKSVISIDGVKNLKAQELSIIADGNFRRGISMPGLLPDSFLLYNFKIGSGPYISTPLKLDGLTINDSPLILEIDNSSGNPISIKSIELSYYSDELIFKSDGSSSYTVEFGFRQTPSPLDTGTNKADILSQPIDRLDFENYNISDNGPYFFGIFNLQFFLLLPVLIIIAAAAIKMNINKKIKRKQKKH